MSLPKMFMLSALICGVASGATGQSLRDRLDQGVSALGEGAQKAGEGAARLGTRIEDTAESSVDLLTNEATPEATRAELDAMADQTLMRLFAEQPESADLFEMSAGYAVFDTRKVVLAGVAAGAGRGVAVSALTEDRVYMNMGTGGVGLSFGIGGFEAQVVMLFEQESDFQHFVTNGYDATASAGSMFGDETSELGVRFVDGRAIFALTNQGWKVSATAAGTKYWVDATLN